LTEVEKDGKLVHRIEAEFDRRRLVFEGRRELAKATLFNLGVPRGSKTFQEAGRR
jgi:hypothetical protein